VDTITSDRELLQRYVDARNAEAFAELARRYSGLVFNTAKRVTGCAADAEDVVQECFLDLARQAAEVRSVLPAWLHCVATRRALNLRSSAIARRNRETSVQPDAISPTVSGEWSELAPLLDQAIVELPEELRAPLLLAFMDGLNHDDIALRLVCSRATVGRRIDEAITRLRRRLERSHGGAMSVSLPAMLLAIPHDPAPVAAVHGAVCIGLAGYGPAAAKLSLIHI
jgi:RNA polymerase sigma factor (sigma-70 family)